MLISTNGCNQENGTPQGIDSTEIVQIKPSQMEVIMLPNRFYVTPDVRRFSEHKKVIVDVYDTILIRIYDTVRVNVYDSITVFHTAETDSLIQNHLEKFYDTPSLTAEQTDALNRKIKHKTTIHKGSELLQETGSSDFVEMPGDSIYRYRLEWYQLLP